MPSVRGASFGVGFALHGVIVLAWTAAIASEPQAAGAEGPAKTAAPNVDEPPPEPVKVEEPSRKDPPSDPVKISEPPKDSVARSRVLQVATDPPPRPPPPPPPVRSATSDGAGPRVTFGRVWTDTLPDGFYGRFETEYFEARGDFVKGMLLGLEGWGTENATAGGGAIEVSGFAGMRASPFQGRKAPALFLTIGAGVYAVVYDRIGDADGFGLLTPVAIATAGAEILPGVRLLLDGRAMYRWHWTSESQSQFQLGITLGLNSDLWDGP